MYSERDINMLITNHYFDSRIESFCILTGLLSLITAKLSWGRWASKSLYHFIGRGAVDLNHLEAMVSNGETAEAYLHKAIVSIILDRNRRLYDCLTISPSFTILHAPCAFGKSTLWILFLQLANLLSNCPNIIPRSFYIGEHSAVQVIIIISAFAIPCSMIKDMVTSEFWIHWHGIGAVAPFLKALSDRQIVTREELLN